MTSLHFAPALTRTELLAPSVAAAIRSLSADAAARILVAPIDPDLADTAAFCEAYDQPLDASANCIVVAGKRGELVTYAACLVLANTRVDVNGVVRKLLTARGASFAATDEAVRLTGMEYGGITPIGLPDDWRVLVDERVLDVAQIIVGSGIRGSKLFLPGSLVAALPGAEIIQDLARGSSRM
jgi:prolyl-tRNA editing enzyme YbaK/EbsC (Cys-tRNA(Pro) deacylase)